MSGSIYIPDARGQFAKDVNRVVKMHRGKSRPFLTIVIEESGDATVLSNMDVHGERLRLLEQVFKKLRGNG